MPFNRKSKIEIRKPCLLAALACALVAQTKPAAPTTKPANYYTLTAEAFFKLPQLQTRITADEVNLLLLDAALFHRTNQERAKAHLPLFTFNDRLHTMAHDHSAEMASLKYFAHESPTPANASLADRLKNVGLAPRTAGENIAVLPVREIGSGNYIVTGDPPNEIYTDKQTHKRLGYYTYADFADAALTQWMNSPPHKADILNNTFLYLGAAAVRGDYQEQDSLYLTQNFASNVPAR
jgi:uncharacterized protein YkwD